MRIIDAVVHLWAADTPERPWPKDTGKPHRPEPLGTKEMLDEMKAAGVDGAIIVPPQWEGNRNDLALAAARQYPDHFAVVGRFDFLDPATRGTLATFIKQPGMLGIRLSFSNERTLATLMDGKADWVWGEAEAANVPIYVLVPHRAMHVMEDLVQRYPSLKIVLNHMALTGHHEKDAVAFADFDRLLPMAKHPNVAVTTSALPFFSSDQYPYRSLHGYLRQTYDTFGPRRMFWGTDMTRIALPYRQQVTMFTEEIPWLTADDKEWIMGRGLVEWLGWNRSAR